MSENKSNKRRIFIIFVSIATVLTGCFVCFIFFVIMPTIPQNTTFTEKAIIVTTEVVDQPTLLPTSIPTLTETPFITNTVEITQNKPTTMPTTTAIPLTTATLNLTVTPLVSNLIVDTSQIIDYSISDVEKKLGSSTETFPFGIGAVEEAPDGGETRTYIVGKYTIWVNYNKSNLAKGLQIIDGLTDDHYTLSEWPVILQRIGVDYAGLPDVEAPAAVRWENASGYYIMIVTNSIGGEIWTVRIYKLP